MKKAKAVQNVFWSLLIVILVFLLWWKLNARKSQFDSANLQKDADIYTHGVLQRGAETKPLNMVDKDWDTFLMVRKMLLARNQPVTFFGHAVDQDGHPLAGVALELDLDYVDSIVVLSPGFLNAKGGSALATRRIVLYSDTVGRFQLENEKGTGLTVRSLTRDGFYWQRPQHLGTFGFDSEGRRHGYEEMMLAFDSNIGYVFHLWRKGLTMPLVPVNRVVKLDQTVEGGNWVTNYVVNLFVSANSFATNEVGWDLAIRWTRSLHAQPNGGYVCHFEISTRHGGLCETSDAYPYAAPTNGYSSVYQFTSDPMRESSNEWVKNFYLRTRESALYAGLVVEFRNFTLRFAGYINPTGSRLLEPDPAKFITDPLEIRRINEATRMK